MVADKIREEVGLLWKLPHPSPSFPSATLETGGRDLSVMAAAEESGRAAEKQSSSYTYWVRETKVDAAPLPVPRKLTQDDLSNQTPSTNNLGSLWNRAGTWEEKNLNTWASNRIKELVCSLGSLELSWGKVHAVEVSKCSGDAFLVIVRNKKRVGYSYELTVKFRGEILIQEETKKFKGRLEIPEFSYGELDDLQIDVRLDQEELGSEEKMRILKDLRSSFLAPIREKLLEFERELRER